MIFEKSLINKEIKNLSVFVILLFFINSIFELIGLSLIPIFLGTLLDNGNLVDRIPFENIKIYLINLERENFILYFLIFILFFFIFKSIIKFISICLESLIYKKIHKLNSDRLYSLYINMPFVKFFDVTPSTLTKNLVQELDQCIKLYQTELVIIREVFLILILLSTTIYLNPLISILSINILLIITLIYFFTFRKKIKKRGNSSLELREILSKNLTQDFNMINQIKLFRLSEISSLNIKNLVEKNENIKLFFSITNQLPRIFFELIVVVGFVTLFLFFLNDKNFSYELLPSLLLNMLILLRFIPSFTSLTGAISRLGFFKPAKKHIEDQLNTFSNNIKLNINKKKIFKFENVLELNNVFLEIKNKKILNDINLNIKKNSSIAIIGPSGSGKSSLLNLLLGLLMPTKGEIIIDKKKLDKNEIWFPEVSYVPQDIYLKDDTIFNNITKFSNNNYSDGTDQKLKEIIKICGLEELITKYNIDISSFKIGDRGAKISGGEKQKIALARAIYSNKDLLVLDEGTSSLDEISQDQIKFLLDSFRGKKTIIFVTHRKSIISNFDHIINLDNGRIV